MKLIIHSILVILLLSLLCFNLAHSSIIIEVGRISHTEAILRGSGFIDYGTPMPENNRHILVLDNPYATQPSNYSNDNILLQSSLVMGNDYMTFAHTAGAGYDVAGTVNPVIYFGSNSIYSFSYDAEISGHMSLSLPETQSLANIGSIGDIYWGNMMDQSSATPIKVGSWQIVAPFSATTSVPEPSTIFLLGVGLSGLVLFRRKHKI